MRVAILEDDANQAEHLTMLLRGAGHHVHGFERGRDLIRSLNTESFDLIVLDWEVPGASGFEVLRTVRDTLSIKTPVLFLTHRDSETDVVQALQAGADDFVVKPPRERELLSRIDALSRRASASNTAAEIIEIGPFRLDVGHRRIEANGRPIELSPRELEVAIFLFRNCGKVVSRNHIMEAVWSRGDAATTRTVDMHVSRVRTALGLSAAIGLRLTAVYGYGYRLERSVKEA